MKRDLNFWLIVISILLIPLCIISWLTDLRWLLLLPGIFFYCVQLLICRKTRNRFFLFLPSALVLLAVVTGAALLFTASGWDTLGGLILLLVCISPAIAIPCAMLTAYLLKRRAD